jgi:hypothetical protein
MKLFAASIVVIATILSTTLIARADLAFLRYELSSGVTLTVLPNYTAAITSVVNGENCELRINRKDGSQFFGGPGSRFIGISLEPQETLTAESGRCWVSLSVSGPPGSPGVTKT